MSAAASPVDRADPSRPAGRDPNYILSQEEFHAGLADLKTGIDSRWRLSQETGRREADGLRETAGWIAVAFALWLLLIGYSLIRGTDLGRPHRG